MSSWSLLDEKEEQELHKSRLLAVEERPFKRITKRIHTISTLSRDRPAQQPTPPAEDTNGNAEPPRGSRDPGTIQRERDQLKEDVTLDFSAFDSSIVRLQFLLDANARERERYNESKERILAESEAVRANNAQLRLQLDESRARLSQRKKFDELAEKITSNRLLRPREDQLANLRKLEEECQELTRESQTYNETWKERRDQFNRIMEEGMVLRQQIRNEKEEAERREGMNEDGEEDGEASRGGQTPKHTQSGNATPRPDGDAPTPRPVIQNGARTPLRESQDGDRLEALKAGPGGLGALSRSGSQAPPSRDSSPHPREEHEDIEEGEDVEMADLGKQDPSMNDTPQITVDGPEGSGDGMEVDGNSQS